MAPGSSDRTSSTSTKGYVRCRINNDLQYRAHIMSQYQDLATRLLAYGEAPELRGSGEELQGGKANKSEAKGTYLLYIDQESSKLTTKLWNGEKKFGKQSYITESVRPNSAAYILTPTTQLILCISTGNELRALSYSDEDDEWVDDEDIMSIKTHPESRVQGTIDANEHVRVVFQDPSNRLVLLDQAGESWTPTILPADPMAGSPIGITIVGRMFIFYISGKDNSLHYVAPDGDAGWKDKVFASCKFEGVLKPKRIMITLNMDNHAFEVYVLTERNALLKITSDGDNDGLKVLGKVDDKGDFVPGDSAEYAGYIWMTPGNGSWFQVPVNWNFRY